MSAKANARRVADCAAQPSRGQLAMSCALVGIEMNGTTGGAGANAAAPLDPACETQSSWGHMFRSVLSAAGRTGVTGAVGAAIGPAVDAGR